MTEKKPTAKPKQAGAKGGARVKPGQAPGAVELRRKRFVEAYIANGGNATEAAKVAGFSEKTAYSQGQRLLKNVEVAAALSERRESLMKKYELSSDMVTRSIVQELSFDPAKLYHESGELKAVTDLDEDTRMALTSIEFEQLGSPDAPVFVRKFKWAQRSSAREQAMKFLGMFEKDNKQRNPLADFSRDQLAALSVALQDGGD